MKQAKYVLDSFVIKTQLIPPRLGKNLLRRERLLKRLQDNSIKKIILLTGGAGYGKTTLLSQFVHELKHPYVFYTINESNKTLVSFISYLVCGVKAVFEDFGERTLSVLEQGIGIARNYEMVIGTFINELVDVVKSEFFIVIDDYQLINDVDDITKSLQYMLEHLPPNVHLLLSSRKSVTFSIAKERAKGNFAEITNDDFRFSPEETQALFMHVYKLNIQDTLLKEIEHYAEGWITALQLTSYLLAKNGNDLLDKLKHGRESLEYFQVELFDREPEEVRSFLMSSSVLQQMSPSSCNYTLNRSDAHDMLNYLIDKNMFISCVDHRNSIFIYHPLFRDFLTHTLAMDEHKKLKTKLHQRAGRYFYSTGNYTRSIKHYFYAGCIDKTLAIIEQQGEHLIDIRRCDILCEWLKNVSDSLMQKSPILLWYQGEVYKWQGKVDAALKVCKKAHRVFTAKADRKRATKVAVSIMTMLTWRGACNRAIRMGKKAQIMLGKHGNSLRVRLLRITGIAYFSSGHVHKATKMFQDALQLSRKIKDAEQEKHLMINLLTCYGKMGRHTQFIDESERMLEDKSNIPAYLLGWLYGNLGLTYALQGEFTKARNTLKNAIQHQKNFNDTRGIQYSILSLGFYYLVSGDYLKARRYFKKVLKLNIAAREREIELQTLHNISRSFLLEGNPVRAEEYIDRVIQLCGTDEIYGGFLLTKGRVKFESGDLGEAESLLVAGLKKFQKLSDVIGLILAHTALAKLYYKRWDENMLVKHLKKALTLSEKYGYHCIVTRLAKINTNLLRYALSKNIKSHYAGFLFRELPPEYDYMIHFFGGLKVIKCDGSVLDVKWRLHKAKSLFCYLFMNRKARNSQDQLTGLLWPGESFSRSKAKLWQTLSLIRSMNGFSTKPGNPLIVFRNGEYKINDVYKVWIDVEEFDQLMKEARRFEVSAQEQKAMSKYELASNLYKGDFLADMYDEWCDERRLFYRGKQTHALERLAKFYLKKSDYDKVTECCHRIIACDEYYESAYVMAIQSYIAQKNRKEAIVVYKRLKTILRDMLDIEPSPDIKMMMSKLKI